MFYFLTEIFNLFILSYIHTEAVITKTTYEMARVVSHARKRGLTMKKIYNTAGLPEFDIVSFKKRLRSYRKDSNYSQSSISELISVTPDAYGKYEQEYNQTIPSVNSLVKLADFYGVSLDYLITGRETPGNEQVLRIFSQCPDEKKETFLQIIQDISKF